jgi:hypothetical protein
MTVSESKESSWRTLGDVVGNLVSTLASTNPDQRPNPVLRTKR